MFASIKRLFVKENSVRGASIILVITLALSNILGVIRDHFLAQKIPTDRLDIYFAAFRLPDLIFNVLILGSIAAAFVPVYTNYLREKGEDEARKLAQATITVGVCAIIICLVILYFIMPYVMHLLVPSFNVLKRAETIRMARWLLLSPLFFTISYFLGGILNSHKRFLAYSIAPLIYNFSIIVSVILFADRLGVEAAVIGVIIGAALHLLIQLPAAIKVGFVPWPRFDFAHSGVRRIVKLMVPRAIGLGANQLLLVAFTVLASAFPGAIAIYTFADNIQTVPSVIFGTSFATAVFPTLASLSHDKQVDRDAFSHFFTRSARAILFLLIPASAVTILLRAQVVRLILGYGFFSWADTRVATATLGFFALSILAQGLIPLLARSFYAMQNTRTPMYASITSIFISIVFGYVFSRSSVAAFAGVPGLALGFTIGSWLNFFILFFLIQKKVTVNFSVLFYFLAKIVLLTIVAAFALQLTKETVSIYFDIDRVRFLALQTVLSFAIATVVYFGGAWLLKIKEIRS